MSYFNGGDFPQFNHIPHQLEMFMDNIWVEFVKILKKEIEARTEF